MGASSGNAPRPNLHLGSRLAGLITVFRLLWAANCGFANGLVINEFLPDPLGSDSGHEFVELLNSGAGSVSLSAVELQFANGAVAAEWVTRWRGQGTEELLPGQRFLIVDRNWQGEAVGNAEVYLGLQNGPDAIRLVDDGVVVDLVGYGPLTDEALFEGEPARIASGLAIARRPDGQDSGWNSADFVLATPTPGSPNFQPYSVTLEGLDLDPPVVSGPGESLRLSIVLRNNGTEVLPAGPCRLVWPGGGVDSWWDGAAPDAGQSLVFVAAMRTRGPNLLGWEYPLPATGDTLRLALGAVQVGAAELRLSEVLPAPDRGQGEWLELEWTGTGAIDLSGYRVRDQDGGWTALPAAILLPGDFLVVAQDSIALAQWSADNRLAGAPVCQIPGSTLRLRSLPTWPSLNNTVPDSRLFADRVYLADSQGLVVDVVEWGGPRQELPDRGLSLERLGPEPINSGAANWAVCTDPAGSTPGCPNSVRSRLGGEADPVHLTVLPPILEREAGSSTVHFYFVVPPAQVSWELAIFNLWGDRVRDFGGDARGPGPRDLIWDGRGDSGRAVGPGAYLVWLETGLGSGLVMSRQVVRMVVR